MAMRNKSLILLLSLVLMLGLLAACNNSNSSSEQPKETAPGNTAAENDGNASKGDGKHSAPFSGGKYDPPITITTVRGIDASVKFKNNETMDDNVHYKWAKEKLGIEIKNLWTANYANDGFNTKLRLALSANKELPDILVVGQEMGSELIESGKFMEVDELFEKYASETYKKAMADDPNVWLPYMKDGKKMGIPDLEYEMHNDAVLWVRQDWLDKLGLKAPTTIDEMEKVMDAFVNQDPDGNGKKDTYGLALGIKEGLKQNMGEARFIFGAYGTIPNQWNLNEDGKLEYGSVQPEMKPALTKLSEWMKKGYLSEQAGLLGSMEAGSEFTSGKVGIISGPHYMPEFPLPDLYKNNKDAVVKPYPLPTGPDGLAGRSSSGAGGGVVLINKDFKHPDAFFEYQNYLFDNFANPEFGSQFEWGLAEGYDWAKVNGEPTTKADEIPGGNGTVSKYLLTPDGIRIPSLRMETYAKLAKDPAPASPVERFLLKKPEGVIEAATIVLSQKDIAKQNLFVGPPTKTQKMRGDFVDKLELETINKIIYGEQPVDSFDTFTEKWMSSGGKQISEEVNEWYTSVQGK
ncbi:sugar ABC transporter [Paenibacillus swuensis]|uniref:Sugar ABC transporter n=1 Tax=Paenibacillus swuensis TaxID=1178515 RepID=A0A172TEV1_9BACL|nr:extracellular solute-binding protein [Paenibacillus swuensis]ANE45466.1 sugar ABC transporter [Paenibacillus swuensis]